MNRLGVMLWVLAFFGWIGCESNLQSTLDMTPDLSAAIDLAPSCVASACPATGTACRVATCLDGACSVANAASGTTCTDHGGAVCDGKGSCVACLAAADCAAQTTLCKTNTCDPTAHTCGTINAALGTTCNDSSGVVCSGAGSCVAQHCADTVKDADETDVDCGGSCGATCKDTSPQQKCKLGADCVSGVCSGTPLLCQPPTCTDGVKNGNETDTDCGGAGVNGNAACTTCGTTKHCAGNSDCTTNICSSGTCQTKSNGSTCASNAECGSSQCVSGTCCNTACAGTCMACTATQTGGTNGTCGNVIAGNTAPVGQCTASPPCGDNGLCNGSGGCAQASMTTQCGAATCTGSTITVQSLCTGTGSCDTMSPTACPGGFICASRTACKTACTNDNDCANTSLYCANPGPSGTCVSKAAAGGACSTNDQCANGICGTSGAGTHCCTTACSPTGGACGATDCDASGACVFPGNTTAPAGLQTLGDCQKIVCNGSGGITSADDATDLPTSTTMCLVDPACCGPSPLTPCFSDAPTGTSCTSDNNPPNQVCGNTGNPDIAGRCVECNNDTDCLSLNGGAGPTCDRSIGACQ